MSVYTRHIYLTMALLGDGTIDDGKKDGRRMEGGKDEGWQV